MILFWVLTGLIMILTTFITLRVMYLLHHFSDRDGLWQPHKKMSKWDKVKLLRNGVGYGTSYWCGGAWNWKESHDINESMFCCCRECWRKMTVDERERLGAVRHTYNKLWEGTHNPPLEDFERAVREEDLGGFSVGEGAQPPKIVIKMR